MKNNYTGDVTVDFGTTAIMPDIIATVAVNVFFEVLCHGNYLTMGIEGVPDFKIIKEQELMEHFRIIYRNNEKFGKKILEDTAKARDTLRVFMVHWLAGIMVSGGHITRDVAIDVQRSLGVLKR